MKITTPWFGEQFNAEVASAEGKEPFVTIKGCRLVNGKNGEFVSYPATKNEKTGKYWQHVWCSEAFSAAVLAEAQRTRPVADTRTLTERKRYKDEAYRAGTQKEDLSDVPF